MRQIFATHITHTNYSGSLASKAVDDAEFRQELISSPKAAIEQEFGITIPDNINLVVHESDARTFHLALPTGPDLSEEQLEALENTYSKSDNVLFMVVPENGDATSEEALVAAVRLTDRAWETPYSSRVDSLANFQHTTAADLSVRDLVDPSGIGNLAERAWIRSTALADPRLAGNLLARDGDHQRRLH